jgi:hypothetical protein
MAGAALPPRWQLCAHPFPGNVRELENLLHRAVALSTAARSCRYDFAPDARCSPTAPRRATARSRRPHRRRPAARAVPMRRLVEVPLQRPAGLPGPAGARDPGEGAASTGFNRTAAAQRLGLSLRQIRYRMARLASSTPGRARRSRVNAPGLSRRQPMAPAVADGWYASARRVRRRTSGPARRRRIDLVVVHSISLPPGEYGGDECSSCSPTRSTGTRIPISSRSRACEVSAHFSSAATARCGSSSAATTAPGTPALALARPRQLQRFLDRHRARRPGRRDLRAAQYEASRTSAPRTRSSAATAPVVGFEPNKIAVAMTKAFLAVHGTRAPPRRACATRSPAHRAVVRALMRRQPGGGTFHIEDVQDQVELGLMRGGEHEVARAYVLYRERARQERAKQAPGSRRRAAHPRGRRRPARSRSTSRARGADRPRPARASAPTSSPTRSSRRCATCTTACRSTRCTRRDPRRPHADREGPRLHLRHRAPAAAHHPPRSARRGSDAGRDGHALRRILPAFIKKGVDAELLDEKLAATT